MRTLAQLRHARNFLRICYLMFCPRLFLYGGGLFNVNDLLQTNILFTIIIRLEKPSSASSDNSIIPFLLLSEARLV